MNLKPSQLLALTALASEAARAAGACIQGYQPSQVRIEHKAVGDSAASQVVTEVDRKAQAIILECLAPSLRQFDLALLTEETPDDGLRLERPAFWSIDPMDGTLAFTQGISGYAVSIGLVSRDGEPLLGVVFDPIGGDLYTAAKGSGTFRNGHRMTLPAPRPDRPLTLRTDVSFQTHPWLEPTRRGLATMAAELGLRGTAIEFRVGAVMNACGILSDANTCYFKYPRRGDSGGSLWDYAASACLLRELGGVASDIHGQDLELNRAGTTFMNHAGILFTSHPPLAARIIALHRRLAATDDPG